MSVKNKRIKTIEIESVGKEVINKNSREDNKMIEVTSRESK